MIHYTIRPGLNGIVPGAFRLRVENENVTGNYLIIITGYFNPGLKILEWVKKKFPKILFAPTRPLHWAASHVGLPTMLPCRQLFNAMRCCSYNLLHIDWEL